MLEAVTAGVLIGVPAEIGKNEQRCLARVFRLALDRFPDFRTQAVGPPDSVDVKRIRARMRDINVMHGNPQKAGRHLAHQLPRDVHGQFVGTGKGQGVFLELVHGKLQQHFQLPQFEFVPAQLRRVEGSFVIIAEQVFVIPASGGSGRQQVLGQNHLRA